MSRVCARACAATKWFVSPNGFILHTHTSCAKCLSSALLCGLGGNVHRARLPKPLFPRTSGRRVEGRTYARLESDQPLLHMATYYIYRCMFVHYMHATCSSIPAAYISAGTYALHVHIRVHEHGFALHIYVYVLYVVCTRSILSVHRFYAAINDALALIKGCPPWLYVRTHSTHTHIDPHGHTVDASEAVCRWEEHSLRTYTSLYAYIFYAPFLNWYTIKLCRIIDRENHNMYIAYIYKWNFRTRVNAFSRPPKNAHTV